MQPARVGELLWWHLVPLRSSTMPHRQGGEPAGAVESDALRAVGGTVPGIGPSPGDRIDEAAVPSWFSWNGIYATAGSALIVHVAGLVLLLCGVDSWGVAAAVAGFCGAIAVVLLLLAAGVHSLCLSRAAGRRAQRG